MYRNWQDSNFILRILPRVPERVLAPSDWRILSVQYIAKPNSANPTVKKLIFLKISGVEFGTKHPQDIQDMKITVRIYPAVKFKKKQFFLGWVELNSETWLDMAQSKGLGTPRPPSSRTSWNALTLHRSPRLQAGLGENELRRRLGQEVEAIYLLGRRRGCWGRAHSAQKHWSTFLVLRPRWCLVVNVLEARGDLKRKTTDVSFLCPC